MSFGHLAHDRQAEPRPVGPAGHKRLEQMIADVGRRSCALIVDRQDHAFDFTCCRDPDQASGRRRVNRVADEIVKGAPHLLGIEVCVLVITGAFELDLLCRGELRMRCDAGVEKGAEAYAFAARLIAFRNPQKPADQRIEPLDLCKDTDSASLFRSAPPAATAFSALSRMAAIGLRIS